MAIACTLAPASMAQDEKSAGAAVSSGKSSFGLTPPASGVDISYGAPQVAGGDTHPTVTLTPDKSELIRLDSDAASVIVGSGEHLGAIAESGRLIILVPRLPGATYFTALDADGKVLMQRRVLVAVPKEKYVRIRRTCAAGAACEPTTVYYCPDMCHRVGLVRPGPDVVTQPSTAAVSANVPRPPADAAAATSPETETVDTTGE